MIAHHDQEQPDLGGGRADRRDHPGLIFAVLTERIRWATAFKLIVFMPMAVSLMASGVIFRLVYEQDPPGRGQRRDHLVHDIFALRLAATPAPGPGRATRRRSPRQGAVVTRQPVQPGAAALIPLVGVKPENLPRAAPAKAAGRGAGRDRRDRVVRLHQGRRRHAQPARRAARRA